MKDLAIFIKERVHIPEHHLQTILSSFQEKEIARDKYLVKKGQFVNSYYFIQSGALRLYLDKGDKQFTVWLAFENDFFTELNSVSSGTPTNFNIQAIGDTSLLTIEKGRMDELYKQIPAWQQFGRIIWEEAFLKVVNGILSHQTMTAEERYRQMMNQSDLLQKVPLKQLASYLGITQTSLSRLRKSIR
ncbi:MAG: Crp/Fnr family transcriptional regulator [Chitinophagaceae bacterium]